MNIKMSRLTHSQVLAGTDRVMAAFPIPESGQVRRWSISVHLIAIDMQIIQSAMWGLSAWLVRVPDPDTLITVDALWDRMVPKDADFVSGGFDLDETDLDVTPEMEIGQPASAVEIFGANLADVMKIKQKAGIVSFASTAHGFEPGAPDKFTGTHVTGLSGGRLPRVMGPTYLLIGLSSPDTVDTTSTVEPTLGESAWVRYQYLQWMLEQAFISLIGLVEAGAETPWEDAASLLQALLEPTVVEEVTAHFVPVTWNATMRGVATVSVPGVIGQFGVSYE